MGDIIDTLMVAGTFRRFVSAIQAAELVDTLRDGVFTVFAPDDEAFAKLPSRNSREPSKGHAQVDGSFNVSFGCGKNSD